MPVFRMIGRKTDIEVVTVMMKLFGSNKACQPEDTQAREYAPIPLEHLQ